MRLLWRFIRCLCTEYGGCTVSVKFGTVDTGVWKHAEFKSLDDQSKLLFMYLKTCDHQNMIGCFYLPVMYICADLKWSEKKVNETLSKLFEKGFVMVDEPLEMVFLPKHLAKHPLQNPNQAKGAEKLFNEVSGKFKHIKELCESLLSQTTLSEPFRNRLTTLCNSITVSTTVTVTETITDKTPPTAVFDHEKHFNEFWTAWPKRGDTRKTANDKFKTHCKTSDDFTEIMQGLNNFIPFYRTQDNKFIPSASTWLNQKRWMDEPPPMDTDTSGQKPVSTLQQRAERFISG